MKLYSCSFSMKLPWTCSFSMKKFVSLEKKKRIMWSVFFPMFNNFMCLSFYPIPINRCSSAAIMLWDFICWEAIFVNFRPSGLPFRPYQNQTAIKLSWDFIGYLILVGLLEISFWFVLVSRQNDLQFAFHLSIFVWAHFSFLQIQLPIFIKISRLERKTIRSKIFFYLWKN